MDHKLKMPVVKISKNHNIGEKNPHTQQFSQCPIALKFHSLCNTYLSHCTRDMQAIYSSSLLEKQLALCHIPSPNCCFVSVNEKHVYSQKGRSITRFCQLKNIVYYREQIAVKLKQQLKHFKKILSVITNKTR